MTSLTDLEKLLTTTGKVIIWLNEAIFPISLIAVSSYVQIALCAQEPRMPYSYRSDSVGSNLAARSAGKYPKNTPTEQDTRNANTTDCHGTGTRRFPGSHGCTTTGIKTAINMPRTDPKPLIKNASSKNCCRISLF